MPYARIYKTTTEAALKSCANAGMTMAEAAAHLGCSPKGLQHCVSVLGIKFRGRYAVKQIKVRANNPFAL